MRVLLITKLPGLMRYNDQDLLRMYERGVLSQHRMEDAQRRHLQSLDLIRQHLQNFSVCERRVDELLPEDSAQADLIITVGGDGTLLAANGVIRDQPVIAVNSDTQNSVGHLTRCNADTFATVLNTFCDNPKDRSIQELLPRLCLRFDHQIDYDPILNDCLFTNQNPAAMTRYRIEIDDKQEKHDSSGVWISTGAGSTGAIHSAGMSSVPMSEPALLYYVRSRFAAGIYQPCFPTPNYLQRNSPDAAHSGY